MVESTNRNPQLRSPQASLISSRWQQTWPLRNSETAVQAITALQPHRDLLDLAAITELLLDPPSAKAAQVAVHACAMADQEWSSRSSPAQPLAFQLIESARLAALQSHWSSVRLAAVEAPFADPTEEVRDLLDDLLRTDPSWQIRQAVVRCGSLNEMLSHAAVTAASDPLWRVRNSFIERIRDHVHSTDERNALLNLLAESVPTESQGQRVSGVVDYLRFCWFGVVPAPVVTTPPEDPHVLSRQISSGQGPPTTQQRQLARHAVAHDEQRVRDAALKLLARWGGASERAAVLDCLRDCRHPSCHSALTFLGRLNLDELQELIDYLLEQAELPSATKAWIVDQFASRLPTSLPAAVTCWADEPALVRSFANYCATRVPDSSWANSWLLARCEVDQERPSADTLALIQAARAVSTQLSESCMQRWLQHRSANVRAVAVRHLGQRGNLASYLHLIEDKDFRVREQLAAEAIDQHPELRRRLASDIHPSVRRAVLRADRTSELEQVAGTDPAWLVRLAAQRMLKRPEWELWEEQPQNPEQPSKSTADSSLGESSAWQLPLLNQPSADLSRLGISGHYLLPEEGFRIALEAGINTMFWEPNYSTLNRFVRRLSNHHRHTLHFITGSFGAEPRIILRDVDRALRTLDLEIIPIFLLFWVRGWNRITDEVRRLLEELQAAGKVREYGLSTHNRQLAAEAIEQQWNPIMVRHNAAHRGAEQHLLPLADRQGTTVITFNNTCYGRLLQAPPFPIDEPSTAPNWTAADCYRFSLAQPGVTTCLTAPATLDHLQENLAVLRNEQQDPAVANSLIQHGKHVYRDNGVFRETVRSR